MRLVETTFSKIPVGTFMYCPWLNDWLFKTSRRMACRGAYARCNMYRPDSIHKYLVLAD